jgi:hypothetical protein
MLGGFKSLQFYKTIIKALSVPFKVIETSTNFTGVEPMGLFWSLKCLAAPNQSARLIKKDVSTPMKFNIKVYSDAHEVPIQSNDHITGTKVERLYKKPGVRRIPLTGKIKGTLFIPEGFLFVVFT